MEEKKKYTYEELEEGVHSLQQQNQYLINELEKANMQNALGRLEFLFRVIENRDAFISEGTFVKDCTHEIVDIMRVSEEDKKEYENNKKKQN